MTSRKLYITPDLRLRAFVAKSYLMDAIDFIARSGTEVLSERQWHRSYRAKVFVDILHICECSLKALYVLLAPTDLTPEQVYRSIRRRRHNLCGLATDVQTFLERKDPIVSQYQMSFLKTASEIGADARYELDVFSISLHWQKFTKVIGPNKRASIKSVRWLRRFHWLSLRLFDRAFHTYEFLMSESKLSQEDRDIFSQRLKSFAGKLHRQIGGTVYQSR